VAQPEDDGAALRRGGPDHQLPPEEGVRGQRAEEDAVIRNFRITAADGKNYDTKHYNLSAIIAVGYKVNSERAVQFRKWATRVVEEFTIKGFAMDDERLKRGGSVLSEQYFEEQLQRVREIRLSERKFYQKITDIYATASTTT
jgi:hypothetical protein